MRRWDGRLQLPGVTLLRSFAIADYRPLALRDCETFASWPLNLCNATEAKDRALRWSDTPRHQSGSSHGWMRAGSSSLARLATRFRGPCHNKQRKLISVPVFMRGRLLAVLGWLLTVRRRAQLLAIRVRGRSPVAHVAIGLRFATESVLAV